MEVPISAQVFIWIFVWTSEPHLRNQLTLGVCSANFAVVHADMKHIPHMQQSLPETNSGWPKHSLWWQNFWISIPEVSSGLVAWHLQLAMTLDSVLLQDRPTQVR